MQIVLYKRRWFILLVCSLINLTNCMSFMTFAPISSFTVVFYRNSYAPMLFNMVFMILSPINFLAMFMVSKKNGLRTSCILCAWLNLVGNLLRLFAASPYYSMVFDSFDHHQLFRFWITLLGQSLSAMAQPFGQYLPTKLAATWFPDSQRVGANVCGTLSAPLGIAVMFALAPQIVNTQRPDAFLLLVNAFYVVFNMKQRFTRPTQLQNGIITVPAALTALLSLGVTSANPPNPPSLSAASMLLNDHDSDHDLLRSLAEEGTPQQEQTPISTKPVLVREIGKTLRCKAFMILNVMMGNGFGISNSVNNNVQQWLCSKGYSTGFAGTMGWVPVLSGLAMAPMIGLFVDRTHFFEETMKVLASVFALSATVLMVLFQMQDMEWFLLLTVAFFGIAGLAIFPIGLELGVETTYPISTSVSNGVLILLGQILGMLFLFMTTFLRQPPTPEILAIQTCTSSHGDKTDGVVYDWELSNMVLAGASVLNAVFFILTFWPKYRRLEYERRNEIIGQENQLIVPMIVD